MRGKGLARAPAAQSVQSARRVGGGGTTKGIVSDDDRPRVNAATRDLVECALLDDACSGHPCAVTALLSDG